MRSGVSASWSQPSYCGGCGASSGAGGAADARRAPVRIARLRRHAAGAAAATADHSPKNTGLKRPARRKGVRIGRILPFRHFSTGMPGSLPKKRGFRRPHPAGWRPSTDNGKAGISRKPDPECASEAGGGTPRIKSQAGGTISAGKHYLCPGIKRTRNVRTFLHPSFLADRQCIEHPYRRLCFR